LSADGQEEYSGQWKNEQRHGTGVQYLAGICKYEGNWKEDLQHGQGSCEWVDGSRYEGEWKQGKRSGKGKFTTATGMKYEGEWLNNTPHGQGICVEDTGDRYMGAFLNGKRHGFGRCLYFSSTDSSSSRNGGENTKSRTKYEGEWQDGKRHGQGTCVYADGDIYIGTWQKDHRHGYGICKFSDGSKFQGQWEDDGWVQSGADPTKCYVAGAGVTRGTVGKKVGFKLLARDEDGNQRLCGGDEFSVQLVLIQEEEESEGEDELEVDENIDSPVVATDDGSAGDVPTSNTNPTATAITAAPSTRVLLPRQIVSVTGEVIDNDDGTYEIHYIATTAGIYELNITLGSGGGTEHVADSPYPVRIVPAKPYSRNTVVQGKGKSHAVIGTPAQFQIILFDKYGNQCSSVPTSSSSSSSAPLSFSKNDKILSEVPLEAYLEGAGAGPMNSNKIPVHIGVDTIQEDALLCSYTAPAQPGYYRLHIEWDGKALPGTPYSVRVVENNETEELIKTKKVNSANKTESNGEKTTKNEEEDEISTDTSPTATASNDISTKTPFIRDEMAAWERIAAAAYAVDGVTEGWDSEEDEIKKKTTSEDAYINSHPDVPVVENLEDLWLVSKLQKERKAKEEEQKRKKLHSVREKLEGEFGPGHVPSAEEAEMALKEILKEEKIKEESEKEIGNIERIADSSIVESVESVVEKRQGQLSRAELLKAAAALDDIC
jgi:hypothetical protein